MTVLKWTLHEYDPKAWDADCCPARRGKKPTSTRCELPRGHEGRHVGRGAIGQYLAWGSL